ncbi:hypothetical protein MnTg02_00883 [bacterium MnTg02]|nr:hypothetical protein MnTg02_00883 [bacterium MnTg02]
MGVNGINAMIFVGVIGKQLLQSAGTNIFTHQIIRTEADAITGQKKLANGARAIHF